jgi:soluble lytic murein transglycosylase
VTRGAGLLIVVLCVLGGFEASVMASVPAPKISETPSKTSEKYSKQRVLYEQALTELRTGIGPRYRAIRAQLADYTLVQYLDYEALIGQLHDMKPHEAKAFLAEADETPLHDRFRHAYLLHKGRDRHWKSFLSVTEGAPRDVELQCYYYRAQRTVGDVDEAWLGAARLWNVGKSQDDACDILFERWIVEGPGPDDALVWSRALKAFDAKTPHLIRYLKRFASPQLSLLLEEMNAVYRRPDLLVNRRHAADVYHAQLLTVGIRRLARVNPGQAKVALENTRGLQPYSDLQLEAMESLIIRHSLFAQSAAPEPWIVETLARLRDDELTEIYLRQQIQAANWVAVSQGLVWLSSDVRDNDRWRYWLAKTQIILNKEEAAKKTLSELANNRSYYGFLAAQQLELPYQLAGASAVVDQDFDDPGLARVIELLALNEAAAARLEWRTMIDRFSDTQKVAAARIAKNNGWDHFAIHAANSAGAWDELELRFPESFQPIFQAAAEQESVSITELLSIARRESAMDPLARSPVGALGLMQVMPSTGKMVARQKGIAFQTTQLQQAEYNVVIGARYYRGLLDRFSQHRPKALAGYNAGPHRVRRWVDSEMSTDQWIESLPFKETREYVQNVLAYAVIYDQRAGREPELLRKNELTTHP